MTVTVNGITYLPSADGKIYGQYPLGDAPVSGSPFTPLETLSFNGLADGADVTGLVTFWGAYDSVANVGTEGDTGITYGTDTSSAQLSIKQGSNGRPGDTAGETSSDNSGDFGWIKNFTNPILESTNEEVWTFFRIFIPTGFKYTTNTSSGLKFVRHSPDIGSKLDLLILSDASGNQTGWNIANENYPEPTSETGRTSSRLFIENQWNTVCFYTNVTKTRTGTVQRLWINDEFVMEHVGGASGITTKWWDNSLQTDTWTTIPNDETGWGTIPGGASQLSNTMIFTYWNGNSPQDQSVNIDKVHTHKDFNDLASDIYGNRYIDSSQVA